MAESQIRVPDAPWAAEPEDVLHAFQVDPERGLSGDEVLHRRARFGRNRLQTKKRRSAWIIFGAQFTSLIVLLLVAAAAVSLVLDDRLDAIAIGAVVVLNGLIGFFTELRAVRSMEALARLSRVHARVRRDGRLQEIPAEELVPGDTVLIEGGDVVSADIRLITASKLQTDESALTGESVPVDKRTEAADHTAPVAERHCMLFKGTVVTRGSGEGVVASTGMNTELGQISALVESAEQEATPLEERLDRLGRRLIRLTLGVVVLVSVIGIAAGRDLLLMFRTAVALAVAAVPEGLPIVATMALAQGMWRMAHQNALINRLSAVETLGATQIIFTDKTGTLTENRMTVTALLLPSGDYDLPPDDAAIRRNGTVSDIHAEAPLREMLECCVLCNNASLDEGDSRDNAVGEPVEVALLTAAARAGLRSRELNAAHPRAREEAFDSDTKMMATFHKTPGGYRIAVKGAPEAVLEHCTAIRVPEGSRTMTEADRTAWLARNQEVAEKGLRLLGIATAEGSSPDAEPYENLTFLGLAAMQDPPRTGVAEALHACRNAGIRVIMVTGDHAGTAVCIARSVGLTAEGVLEGRSLPTASLLSEDDRTRLRAVNVFARLSPGQKLDLIQIHQDARAVVAMTGDGVNDAPALKKADIGIAMGIRGTQVAREASDMVLKDDAFETIVVAIEQGRVIFGNIRKFVIYLLSCNISEILVVGLASASASPLPLFPIQILFLNLVTDVFPALALGVGKGDSGVMRHAPRPSSESILTRKNWMQVAGYGTLITAATLTAFWLALNFYRLTPDRAVTVTFLTLAFAQLLHVFNMRDRSSGVFRNEVTRNVFIWLALALCSGLLVLAVYVPVLAGALRLMPLEPELWIVVLCLSASPLLVSQLLLAASRES